MKDYEYLFATALHARLRETIQAKRIFCKVNEKDELYVEIKNEGVGMFVWTLDKFSERLIYGLSVLDAENEIRKEFKKFIFERFFK